ncbi:unnamed protein product [Parnassius apollo]|uniref:(apollo) hypothetical protein n=1 Tax=Parnassius apollo TaxID=110799 RepID=A0A8S3XXW4_PARAO|nr:unnamed protein product [Parnassius apollo]
MRQHRAKRVAEECAAWLVTDGLEYVEPYAPDLLIRREKRSTTDCELLVEYQASDLTQHKDHLSIDSHQHKELCTSKNSDANSQCPKN